MACSRCTAPSLNPEARFCSRCSDPLPVYRTGIGKTATVAQWLAAPFVLIGRALAYPIKLKRERIRWLTEASGPDSPINDVPGLSDGARRVYAYLASVNPALRIVALSHPDDCASHRSVGAQGTRGDQRA
jgi:hypothetical protein